MDAINSVMAVDIVTPLMELTGESEDIIRMYVCLLACLPIALFHRALLLCRSPTLQHLYFFSTGLSLLVFWLGWDVMHLVIPALLNFILLCLFAPSPYLTVLLFCGPFIHLIYGYYSDGSESYRLGWMAPGCINVQALFALTMDVADGRLPMEKRNADQKKLALEKPPSLLAFLGFKFNPITTLIGPMVNFRDYENFILGTHLNGFDHKQYSLTGRSSLAALVCIIESVLSLALMFAGDIIMPSSFLLSDEFMEYSLPSRIVVISSLFFLNFGKYLSVWKLLEAASCICTLGYSGTDKSGPKFELCRQVYVWELLTAKQLTFFSSNFNCATHRFTKRYIFKRLAFLGSKDVSLLISVFYLAIWHGVHFGYVWTFVLCEFFEMGVELLYTPVLQNLTGIRSISDLPLVLRVPMHLLCTFYVFCGLGYGYIGMTYLQASNVLLVAGRVFFFQHIICVPLFFLHRLLPARLRARPAALEKKMA